MWRCRGVCRNMLPYFGFIWLKNKNGDPKESLMFMHNDVCEHNFESYGDDYDPKGHLTEWECIEKFNKFIAENKIQIKTKEMYSIENCYFTLAPSIHEPDEDEAVWMPPAIPGKHYMNFDDDSKTFISVGHLDEELYNTNEPSRTVCLICSATLAEDRAIVVQHLKNCTGIDYPSEDNAQLPILKILKSEERGS